MENLFGQKRLNNLSSKYLLTNFQFLNNGRIFTTTNFWISAGNC